jgi:GTPase SAR1 family protein
MSQPSTTYLTELIKLSLNDLEISKGLREVNLSNQEISNTLITKAEEIFKSVSFSQSEYDEAMGTIEDFNLQRPSPSSYSWKRRAVYSEVIKLFFVILSLCSIFFLVTNDLWHRIQIPFINVENIISNLLTKIIIGLLSITGYVILGKLVLEFLNKIEKNKNKESQKKWLGQNRTLYLRFLEAKKIKNGLLNEEEVALVLRSIKEIIRSEINRKVIPSYDLEIDNVIPSGLSEVIDLSKSIDTSSKQKLDFLINNMPGGSIGIAGSRGAGKSTLIKSYCDQKSAPDKIKGKIVLPVITTAPVNYNSRDFILHLFYSTCKSVLNHFNTAEREITHNPTYLRESKLKKLITLIFENKFRMLFTGLGIILLAFFLWTFREFIQTINSSASTVLYFKTLLKEKSIPFTIATIGLLLTLLALCIIFHSAITFVANVITSGSNEQLIDPSIASDEETKKQQINIIQDWIVKIRYQQSFTAGWSGGISLPLAEASVTGNSTFSENLVSNPEIVASFTQLLSEISKQFQVIIGIDELDKLNSEQEASTFLNEIKSIFGIRGCFFLISVSENAINSFERRGLPFRDVFDSSFDSIVYVEHLNLRSSTELLQRRVIGRPVPFFALAYCLSAGLPRDIIRYYREIVRLGVEDNNLYTITKRLLTEDLNSKLRAMMSSLSINSPSDLVHQLGSILNDLQAKELTLENLDVSVRKILDHYSNEWEVLQDTPDSTGPNFKSGIQEIKAYLLYISTVWAVFDPQSYEANIRLLEQNGFFDRLAASRQAFYTNLSLAIDMIKTCRQERNMTLPQTISVN